MCVTYYLRESTLCDCECDSLHVWVCAAVYFFAIFPVFSSKNWKLSKLILPFSPFRSSCLLIFKFNWNLHSCEKSVNIANAKWFMHFDWLNFNETDELIQFYLKPMALVQTMRAKIEAHSIRQFCSVVKWQTVLIRSTQKMSHKPDDGWYKTGSRTYNRHQMLRTIV